MSVGLYNLIYFFFLVTPCMCWSPQNCQYSCECLFQHPPPILFHFGANRVPAYARCACVSVHSGHYTWHYSFFLFLFFFSHSLTFLPAGVCQESWNIPRSGRWSACTMGKWDPLSQTQYYVTKHLISLLWTCYSLIVKYIIEIFKSKKWLFEFFVFLGSLLTELGPHWPATSSLDLFLYCLICALD